ncbi:MAG: hypothetical protein AAFY57_09715 [Cyanobacteria bacterium J06642_2]
MTLRVDTLPHQSHANERSELQRIGAGWDVDLADTLEPAQLAVASRAFAVAGQPSFLVNLRFSIPWQGQRYFVTFVVCANHRPARFPRQADWLGSLDPFLASFWQAVPSSIIATLSAAQCQAIERALKPYCWQDQPVDMRGSLPWRNRSFVYTLVAGLERRSRERISAEREKHPLWTGANTVFLLLLQLPFVLTVVFGLGLTVRRSHWLPSSTSRLDPSIQAIEIGVRDPIAREAYLNSDVQQLRDRLQALGLETAIRNRSTRRLSDSEYEQLILRAFHQRLTVETFQAPFSSRR